ATRGLNPARVLGPPTCGVPPGSTMLRLLAQADCPECLLPIGEGGKLADLATPQLDRPVGRFVDDEASLPTRSQSFVDEHVVTEVAIFLRDNLELLPNSSHVPKVSADSLVAAIGL